MSRAWLALLLFPFGFWTRRTLRSLLLLVAVAILLAAAPGVFPLAPLGIEEAAACVAGWLAGVVAHVAVTHGRPPSAPVAPLRQSLR